MRENPGEPDIDVWVAENDARGRRLEGNVLGPRSAATTVRVRDGELLICDGPFAETKEVIVGYDLIEVVNGPFAAEDVWDAALSAGHPVWAVANDDTHDLTDSHRTAAGWNMIDAATSSTADVVDALEAAARRY